MQDEGAFLKAIAQEPENDVPRLVYADWLQEHGGDQNRANLIRLQCYLEKGIDYLTGQPAAPHRLKELRKEQGDLLSGMFAATDPDRRLGIRELTPEITDLMAAGHCHVSFRRGMIDMLSIKNTRLDEIPPDLFVGGDLLVQNCDIAKFSEGLTVVGSLNLWNSRGFLSLPTDVHIGGDLFLVESSITRLPAGLHVGRDLTLGGSAIEALPSGLCIGGNLDLSGTQIHSLPFDLRVDGYLDFINTQIDAHTARSVLTMPNLSRKAKISCLETAGFLALAEEARRIPIANTQDIPPR